MDNSKDTRSADQRRDDEVQPAPGDVLGLSRIAPGGGTRKSEKEAEEGDDGDAHQPPEPREREHVGSRDVTEGTSGGTGPDTGGSGVFRRRSGATGTDIGR